ncbi:MAG TPA: ATP12 family protein [Rhodopila sp.]|uniref:ATP12 family chaperone protein n=1 Tax=Rhodopila sp. TaxID=2480087 RepID=UPI002C1AC52D|nr:ATP12 family protein [Rhodopila sp.]HVY15631.1 ATP12 family protein [Rhodopila sp.]
MKRFWDQASAAPVEGGFEIHLDGKPMRLPSSVPLLVRSERLARAIAAEWQAAGGGKGGEMSFSDTPLTRLAGTAQERIAPDPHPTVDAIARYGESDLLCYRAETPAELVRRQTEGWQPWLDWMAATHGAPLRVTAGVGFVRQHHDTVAALRNVVAAYDADALAGLGVAVPALGSLVLGLALAAGMLDAEAAHRLASLDELFQMEQWGEDPEAAARRANILTEIKQADRYLGLVRGDA